LKVIGRSALDLQRVLDALVESAARLCDAYDATVLRVFGDGLRIVAHHGQIPTAALLGQRYPLARGLTAARAIIDRRTIHVADIPAEGDEYPESRKNALQQGYRTSLAVPLVHAGEAIGVILIRRAVARPFTERQIELSQLRERSWRCTAVASGLSRRWVGARRSAWNCRARRGRCGHNMSKRILVVEDQEDLRAILRDFPRPPATP
jgi:hypothetical protein